MSVTQMPLSRMTEAEWRTRIDLAACYRLVDLFGWSDLINTRITARVPLVESPGSASYFRIIVPGFSGVRAGDEDDLIRGGTSHQLGSPFR